MFTDFQNTFDMTNALCALFLWLLFGFLSNMINCDLQRMIESSLLVRHTVGLLAFFFLFTLIDGKSTASVQTVFLKTFVVYALFLFSTKSKWMFALPVLILLMLDQVLKKHYEHKKAVAGIMTDEEADGHKDFAWFARVNQQINVLIIILIVLGTLHYAWLQKLEYGKDFRWRTFFFAVNKQCKPYHPDYNKFMQRRG